MKPLHLLILLLTVVTLFAAESKFPVKVSGTELILNDGTNRRFFLAGMVANNPQSGEQLSEFDTTQMTLLMQKSNEIGANAIRWNAFLFGKDITWDVNGLVSGLHGNSLSNLKKGLDLAYENEMMVQIVLTTAHFLKFGWGGETNEYNGTTNGERVKNNLTMFTTDEGIQAYIDNIIIPMTDTLGIHPSLFGFCISNEAYGMTQSLEFGDGWSDSLVAEDDFAKFANRVSGELHRRLPGVICSISSIARKGSIYTSDKLVAAGGDTDGILDIYQYQYYPENHTDSDSPFLNSIANLANTAGIPNDRPAIAGEFWMHGITDKSQANIVITPTDAYEALWTNGLSGGFTWSDYHYFTKWGADTIATIDRGYTTFNTNHLAGLDPWEFWPNDTGGVHIALDNAITDNTLSVQTEGSSFVLSAPLQATCVLTLYCVNGSLVYRSALSKGTQSIQLNKAIAKGFYLLQLSVGSEQYVQEIILR